MPIYAPLMFRRFATPAMLIALCMAVGSCQIQPLYAKNSGVKERLASVSFSDANSRAGLVVRNRLVFLAGGGAGEPITPAYKVKLSVTTTLVGVIYLPSSSTSAAARQTVTVQYILSNAVDGKILKAGSRVGTALLDQPTQTFAQVRADIDAEQRAATEAADLVAADLSAALSRTSYPIQ